MSVHVRYVKDGDRFELGDEFKGVFVPFATVDGANVRTAIRAGKDAAAAETPAPPASVADGLADHGEHGTGAGNGDDD